MPLRTILLFCLVALVPLGQAHARSKPEVPEKKPKAEAQENLAKKACATGDFRKGVEILADLYVRTDDTTYIYNQGRCYEQNHQWVSAIDRFREYLRKAKDLSAGLKAEVEKHIADCKLFMEEEASRAAPPPPPPQPNAPVPPPGPQPTVQIVAPPPTPAPAPVESSGSTMRTTGIIVGGVGVATLATAIALNLKANSLADEVNKNHDPATESSQKSYKTGAIMCYGVGGVALVAGTVMYLVGRSKGPSKSAGVALLPTWSPGEAGLSIAGEF